MECKPYATVKDELSLVGGSIIMWGLRVVITASLRNFLLGELRCTHPGIIEMGTYCNECIRTANAPNAVSPHPWERPTKPMQRIRLDFVGPFYEHSGWIDAHQVVKKIDSTSTT